MVVTLNISNGYSNGQKITTMLKFKLNTKCKDSKFKYFAQKYISARLIHHENKKQNQNSII